VHLRRLRRVRVGRRSVARGAGAAAAAAAAASSFAVAAADDSDGDDDDDDDSAAAIQRWTTRRPRGDDDARRARGFARTSEAATWRRAHRARCAVLAVAESRACAALIAVTHVCFSETPTTESSARPRFSF
jgi:hypothetical protein